MQRLLISLYNSSARTSQALVSNRSRIALCVDYLLIWCPMLGLPGECVQETVVRHHISSLHQHVFSVS